MSSHSFANGIVRVPSPKVQRDFQQVDRLRAHGFVLVEGCRQAEGLFTRENFAGAASLRPSERRLVLRLFDGQMSEREFTDFFSSQSSRLSCVCRVNRAFRDRGVAIVRTCLDRRKRHSGSCWVLHLNPELFEAPPVRVFPGKTFGWRDLLSPFDQRVLAFLIENSYSAPETISLALKLKLSQVNDSLTSRINKRMRAVGLPKTVCITRHRPHLYFATQEFARLFEEEVRVAKISKEAFSVEEWRLIQFMATHPNKTTAELAQHFRSAHQHFFKRIRHITEKAVSFSLPAFKVNIVEGVERYSLCTEFAEALGLTPARTPVPELFNQNDLPVLRAIVERPGISQSSIQHLLGLSKDVVCDRCERIERVCENNRLGLVKISRHPHRYYVTEEFARPFVEKSGWQFKPVQPLDLFNSELDRAVCGFFLRKPEASIDDCVKHFRARRLRVARVHVRVIRAKCNKLLEKHGFGQLASLARVARFEEFARVQEAFVAHRLEHGRWPEKQDLRDQSDALAYAVSRLHGGVKGVVGRLSRNQEISTAIAVRDLEKMRELFASGRLDLSRLDGELSTVMTVARNAVIAGVEFTSLTHILASEKGAAGMLEAINELISASYGIPAGHDPLFSGSVLAEAI